jgi:Fe-Mn family superoxide dismutase
MFELPTLPYPDTALAPVVSAETLKFHHGKHHAGYVRTLNGLLADGPGHAETLEQVIAAAAAHQDAKLFNNAAQCWNHSFFWLSMSPKRMDPDAALTAQISRTFGDLAGLRTSFVAEGIGHFGSGWVWLTADRGGQLAVTSTHDAHNPLGDPGRIPLLVCDLWEHAYYLDHQNDRAGFLGSWFDKLADWTFAGQQFHAAVSGAAPWRHPLPVHAVA